MKYVLLTGADIGNREEALANALSLISDTAGRILLTSKIYESEPWGFLSETTFLNQAILINSQLEPEVLLESLKKIETVLGRTRSKEQWSSRSIDVDILCCENETFTSDALIIPHPRLHERVFALKPLVELVPNWRHPFLLRTYNEILKELLPQSLQP